MGPYIKDYNCGDDETDFPQSWSGMGLHKSLCACNSLSDHGEEGHIIMVTSCHSSVHGLASYNWPSEVQQKITAAILGNDPADELLAVATPEQLQQMETTNVPVNMGNSAAVSAPQPINFANAAFHGCTFQFTIKI